VSDSIKDVIIFRAIRVSIYMRVNLSTLLVCTVLVPYNFLHSCYMCASLVGKADRPENV